MLLPKSGWRAEAKAGARRGGCRPSRVNWHGAVIPTLPPPPFILDRDDCGRDSKLSVYINASPL